MQLAQRMWKHSTGYLDLVKYRMASGYFKCCSFFSQLQFLVLLYTYLSAPSLLPFASISHYQLLLLADTNPASKLSSSREDNCFKEIQFTVSSTGKEDLKPGEVTDLGKQIKSPSNISLAVMRCFYFWLLFQGMWNVLERIAMHWLLASQQHWWCWPLVSGNSDAHNRSYHFWVHG